MMKKFAVSVIAHYIDDMERVVTIHEALVAEARNSFEATGIGQVYVQDQYPTEDGYHGHSAAVVDMNSEPLRVTEDEGDEDDV